MPKEVNARKKILKSAERIFSQKGYHAAGVQEIADAAGVNKAMLFYYFKSKDNLFASILAEARSEIFKKISHIKDSHFSPEEKLKEFAGVFVETIFEKEDLLRVAMSEIVELKNKLHSVLFKHFKEIINPVEEIIKSGIKEGKFKKMNPKMVALAFLGIIKVLSTQKFITGQKFSRDEIVRFAHNLVFSGIKK